MLCGPLPVCDAQGSESFVKHDNIGFGHGTQLRVPSWRKLPILHGDLLDRWSRLQHPSSDSRSCILFHDKRLLAWWAVAVAGMPRNIILTIISRILNAKTQPIYICIICIQH
jgi:hypothetical protein